MSAAATHACSNKPAHAAAAATVTVALIVVDDRQRNVLHQDNLRARLAEWRHIRVVQCRQGREPLFGAERQQFAEQINGLGRRLPKFRKFDNQTYNRWDL
jgi:hypothetical protein